MDKTKSDMITIMRVVSCIMVTMIHTTGFVTWPGATLTNIVARGQDGLWVFMILSGYLIGRTMYKYRDGGGYFCKRLLRIGPAYWGWCCVLLFYSLITKSFTLTLFDWVKSFAFCILIIPTKHFNGMWGLGRMSSFFFFYLIFPFIYRKVKTVDKGIVFLIFSFGVKFFSEMILGKVFMIYKIEGDPGFASITPLSDICYFASGYLLYLAERDVEENSEKQSYKILALLAALLLIAFRLTLVTFIPCLLVGLIVGVLLMYPFSFPVWFITLCRKINPFTYTLYLVHPSIYAFIAKYIPNLTNYPRIFIMYSLSFLAAIILHYLTEVPVNAFWNNRLADSCLKKTDKRSVME